YDDCGSWGLLPKNYEKELQNAGIQCRVFNPLRPSLTITMNNRDHRKILIIDGKVGFTGGINIADEYINHIEKHGHWKDTAILLRGQAVNTLISLFFEMWNLIEPGDEDVTEYYNREPVSPCHDGYIQPYGADPFSNDPIGEHIYLNLINKAQKEILISSPYLIIDNEMTTALCLAAKSGVSVTILTPHIADKWYVHLMTVSSYLQLMKAGVNIYEYTPGFVHAKMFAVDGKIATVGTVNLDYRSLYLHFECGAILYDSTTVSKIQKDILDTLSVSQKIVPEDLKKIRWYHRVFQRLVQALAPLL
ncbi:MAG: cardiolipin synthase, partial [Clostridia bacterium]|nr:cardiolipin synthase [Clostridia bacterium]